MGYGDAIMATALARGLYAQGKLLAFYNPHDGGSKKIKWSGYCEDIFKHNPNIARPGCIDKNLIWLPHYKKVFPYTKFDGAKRRFIWDYDFKAKPGEFFFLANELQLPKMQPFIFIEPNLAWQRQVNRNKDWGDGKFEALAKLLIDRGHRLVQCIHGNSRRVIHGAHHVRTNLFHEAAAIMSHASLIISPEGANHHAAAALGVKAVIPWGGFSPPQTMGYEGQIKLTGGVEEACGSVDECKHCRKAFDNISVDEVYQAALQELH